MQRGHIRQQIPLLAVQIPVWLRPAQRIRHIPAARRDQPDHKRPKRIQRPSGNPALVRRYLRLLNRRRRYHDNLSGRNRRRRCRSGRGRYRRHRRRIRQRERRQHRRVAYERVAARCVLHIQPQRQCVQLFGSRREYNVKRPRMPRIQQPLRRQLNRAAACGRNIRRDLPYRYGIRLPLDIHHRAADIRALARRQPLGRRQFHRHRRERLRRNHLAPRNRVIVLRPVQLQLHLILALSPQRRQRG